MKRQQNRFGKIAMQSLAAPGFTSQGITKRIDVKVICATDDPIDSLEYHEAYANKSNGFTKILPAFRPDKAMAVENVNAFLS
jgi:glucuronate isomerase